MADYSEFELRLAQLFSMALGYEEDLVLGPIEGTPYWAEIQRLKRLAQAEAEGHPTLRAIESSLVVPDLPTKRRRWRWWKRYA